MPFDPAMLDFPRYQKKLPFSQSLQGMQQNCLSAMLFLFGFVFRFFFGLLFPVLFRLKINV